MAMCFRGEVQSTEVWRGTNVTGSLERHMWQRLDDCLEDIGFEELLALEKDSQKPVYIIHERKVFRYTLIVSFERQKNGLNWERNSLVLKNYNRLSTAANMCKKSDRVGNITWNLLTGSIPVWMFGLRLKGVYLSGIQFSWSVEFGESVAAFEILEILDLAFKFVVG
ncbi:hypothetical protein Tco_1421593 [Tanacetum coccineum]